MPSYDINGKRIWITGASSGLGKALAEQLGQHDCQLILSGRNADALAAVAQGKMRRPPLCLPFDINDKQAHRQAVVAIESAFSGLDMVIFNAGICEYYDAQQFDSEVFAAVMQTNFFSVVYGIEAVLPLLRQSADPYIVSTSSIAAAIGLPFGLGAYCASKAALDKMLRSLAIELYPRVNVLIVSPGFIDTAMSARNPFMMPTLMSTDRAVTHILHAIAKRKSAITFPKRLDLLVKLAASLPRSWYRRLMHHLTGYATRQTKG